MYLSNPLKVVAGCSYMYLTTWPLLGVLYMHVYIYLQYLHVYDGTSLRLYRKAS